MAFHSFSKYFNQVLKTKEFIILLLSIISLVLRFYSIRQIPYGLEGDELTWSASSLARLYHIDPNTTGIWSLVSELNQKFPLSVWFNQMGFLLFGNDLISPRPMMAIIGTIIVIEFYFLLRVHKITPVVSLLAALMYSTSTYRLITSRIAFPHNYSSLLILPAFTLLVIAVRNLSKQSHTKSWLLIFLSSIMLTLSLYSYNLTYLAPTVAFIYLLISSWQIHLNIKTLIISMIVFTLPLAVFSIRTIKTIRSEYQNRDYALEHVVISLKPPYVFPQRLVENIKTVNQQLFKTLTYDTSDMLVSFPAPLIDRLSAAMMLVGLCISVIFWRQYLLTSCWLIFGVIPYLLLIGFTPPRTWNLHFDLIYFYAAIGLFWLYSQINHLNHYKWIKYILYSTATLIIVYASIYNVKLFFNQALSNQRYLVNFREFYEMAKQLKCDSNTAVIADSSFALTAPIILNFICIDQHHDNSYPAPKVISFSDENTVPISQLESTDIIITSNLIETIHPVLSSQLYCPFLKSTRTNFTQYHKYSNKSSPQCNL